MCPSKGRRKRTSNPHHELRQKYAPSWSRSAKNHLQQTSMSSARACHGIATLCKTSLTPCPNKDSATRSNLADDCAESRETARDVRETSGKKSGEMSHRKSVLCAGNGRAVKTATPLNVRQVGSQGNSRCVAVMQAVAAPETCKTKHIHFKAGNLTRKYVI